MAMLNIEKYVDEFGNVVEPNTRYSGGTIRYAFPPGCLLLIMWPLMTLTSHPPPFKCKITPRSKKCEKVVASVEL